MGLSFPGNSTNKATQKNTRNNTKPSFHSFSLFAHYRPSLFSLSISISASLPRLIWFFGRPPSLIVCQRRWAENLARGCRDIVQPVQSMYYYCHHVRSITPLLPTQPVATSTPLPTNRATSPSSISLSRDSHPQTSSSVKPSPSSDSLPLPFPSFCPFHSAWTHPVSVC